MKRTMRLPTHATTSDTPRVHARCGSTDPAYPSCTPSRASATCSSLTPGELRERWRIVEGDIRELATYRIGSRNLERAEARARALMPEGRLAPVEAVRAALRKCGLVGDIVSETFERADRQAHLSRLPADEEPLRQRLRYIAKDVIRDVTNHHAVGFFAEHPCLARQPTRDNASGGFNTEAHVEARCQLQQVAQALPRLTSDERDLLAYVIENGSDGLDEKQRKRLSRARAKLRRATDRDKPHPPRRRRRCGKAGAG